MFVLIPQAWFMTINERESTLILNKCVCVCMCVCIIKHEERRKEEREMQKEIAAAVHIISH